MNQNKELLDTQMNVDIKEDRANYSIVDYEHIDGTPFTAVRENEGNWMINVGDYIIEKTDFVHLEDLVKYIESKPWGLILNACYVYNLKINQLKEQQNGNN